MDFKDDIHRCECRLFRCSGNLNEVRVVNQNFELPHDIDAEKELLSAMLVRNGEKFPAVTAIVSAEDFYRPEHQIIFGVMVELYAQDIPPNILSVFDELKKTKAPVEFSYLRSIAEISFTNAYAVAHAKIVKEKSKLRRLMETSENVFQAAQEGSKSTAEIIASYQRTLEEMKRTCR